jgi:MFS family permease
LSQNTAAANLTEKKPRFFYGYVIVAVCFLVMTLGFGAQNTFGVFFKPMAVEFGWSRAATSGPFALYMVVSGILSIISGRLSDRFGPKLVVSLGGAVLGAGYILMSRTDNLWELYLYYGVLVAAGSSSMYVPMVAMIARWFTKNRGLMSGIGIAGIGFGIGVMPALASWLLEKFQWRTPLWIIGVSVGAAIILLAQLLRNRRPEPDTSDKSSGKSAAAPAETGLAFNEAVKTRQFWMIFMAWICYGYFFQIGVVHLVPYATDLGMTAVAAAAVLSIIGIIGTAGRIGLGFIGDKFGNRRTLYISYALIGLSFLGLAVSHTVGMLYVFAVIFGALFGVGILLVPIIAEYFGFKGLGLISGLVVFSNSFGGAIGPPVAGGIFDASGSYTIAFISCAVIGVAAGVFIWLLKPVRKT